ncbi:DUF4214 domain-containing protein [Verticiella sediminum]|nr:DUF4214 domain-containing protein [Verticiella sediminum]
MAVSLLDTLDWGSRLEGSVITYAFYDDGATVDLDMDEDGDGGTQVLAGWTDYEKQQARLAFETFARVTQLSFVEVEAPEDADIRLALFDFDAPGMLGFGVAPGAVIAGQGGGFAAFNIGSPLWSREAGGNLDQGGYAFITLTHEFGHVLGLAHPHDDGGGSPLMPGVIVDTYHPQGSTGFYELNQGVYTMMSYNDGWITGPLPKASPETPYGWATGPMALDIAILQQKYGVNDDPGHAHTVYRLLDEPAPGYGYTTIWSNAGGHIIMYQGERDAVINLQPATLDVEWGGGGWLSYVDGVTGGFTIAHGVDVLNAISGSGNDTLIGNALDNLFDAGLGENTIYGNGGADVVLYGGSVHDYAVTRDDEGAWVVQADDESRQDTLHDIRQLDFDEGRLYVEALAQESLAVGALYLSMLDRLPDAEGYGYWTGAVLGGVELGTVAGLLGDSDEFSAGYGAASDADYVEVLYQTLLMREADEEGATYWIAELTSGALNRGTLALQFLEADEQPDAFLEALVDTVITFGDLWA